MRDLNAQLNMTFVFSTHDQKIMDRADRLIHLEDGVIQLDETRQSSSGIGLEGRNARSIDSLLRFYRP